MITEMYMQLAGVILAIIYIGNLLRNFQLFLSLPSNSGTRLREEMQLVVPAEKPPGTGVLCTGARTPTDTGEGHGTESESTSKCEQFQDAQLCPTGSKSTTCEQYENKSKQDIWNGFHPPSNQYSGRFGQSTRARGTRSEQNRLIQGNCTIKDFLASQPKFNVFRPSEGSHQGMNRLRDILLSKIQFREPEISHHTRRHPPEVLQESSAADYQDQRGPPLAILPRSSSLRSPAVSDPDMKKTPAAVQRSPNLNSPVEVQQDKRDSSFAIRSSSPYPRSAARTFVKVDRAPLRDYPWQRSAEKKQAFSAIFGRQAEGTHRDTKQQPADIQLCSSESGQAENYQDRRGPPSPSLTATALKDQAVKQPSFVTNKSPTVKSLGVSQQNQNESPYDVSRNYPWQRSAVKTFKQALSTHFERQAGGSYRDTKEQSAVMQRWPSKTSPYLRSANHEIDKMPSSADLRKPSPLKLSTEGHQQIAGSFTQRSSSVKSAEVHHKEDALLQRSSTMRVPAVKHEAVKEQNGIKQRSSTFVSDAIIHHDGEQQPVATEKRSSKSLPAGNRQESAAFDRSSSLKLSEGHHQDLRGSSLVIRPGAPLLRSTTISSVRMDPANRERSPTLTSTAENHQNTTQQPAVVQRISSTRAPSVNHQHAKQQPAVLQSWKSPAEGHQELAGLPRSSTLNYREQRRPSPAVMQRSSSLRPPAGSLQCPVIGNASSLRSPERQLHQSPNGSVALPEHQSLLAPERHRQARPVQIALPEPVLANRNRKYVTWKRGEDEEISSGQKSGGDASTTCQPETWMCSARPTPESPRSHQKRLRTKGIRKFLKAIGGALSGKQAILAVQ